MIIFPTVCTGMRSFVSVTGLRLRTVLNLLTPCYV